jgi:hypothetical protein
MAYQSPTLFNWTNLSHNSCDLTDSNDPLTFYQAINGCDPNQFPYPDIIGIPVWCLKNPYWPGQGCAQWSPYTKRSWDLSVVGTPFTNPANGDLMPQAPGLTLQDYADILQADPFVALNSNAINVCHPTYGPSVDPNDPEYIPSAPVNPSSYNKVNYAGTPSTCTPPGDTGGNTMTRFQPYGTVEYPEPGPNGLPTTYSGQFQYSQTQTQGTISTDTHTLSTSWNTTASFGFSFGFASFDAALTVGGQNSTTWQNQSNTSSTNTNGQYASYSITGPQLSDNYTGPPTYNVYMDNVYGTFAFYSDLEPQVTLGDVGISSTSLNYINCPVNNAQENLTFAQVSVGSTSTPQTLYLFNCSYYPLTMAGPAVSFSDPGFQIVPGTDTCSNQVLQAMDGYNTEGACSFQVVFEPVNSDAPNLIYGTTNPVNAYLIAAGTENASSYQNILITDHVSVTGTATNPYGAVGGTLFPTPVQNPPSSTDPFSQNVYDFTTPSNFQTAQTQKFTFTNYSGQAVYFYDIPWPIFSDALGDFELYSTSSTYNTCYDQVINSLGTCYFYVSYLPISSPPPSGVYGTRITLMGSLGSGATPVPVAIGGAAGPSLNILTMSPSPFSGSLNNPPQSSYNIIPTPITIKNNSSVYSVNYFTSSGNPNTWALLLTGTYQSYTSTCGVYGTALLPGQSCIAYVEALNQGAGTFKGSVTVTGMLGDPLGTVNVSATDNGTYTQIGAGPTITITGAEQSETVQVPPTYAKGSITVNPLVIPAAGSGTLSSAVGTFNATASYAAGASGYTAAKAMVTDLNVVGSPVKATASGSIITLKSIAAGSAGNLALGTIGDANFQLLASGATLTDGKDATTETKYDGGTINVTTAGVTASATWGSKSTPQSIAKALAASINKVAGAYWKASASGDAVALTSVSQTPPSITVTANDLKGFAPASFGATTN